MPIEPSDMEDKYFHSVEVEQCKWLAFKKFTRPGGDDEIMRFYPFSQVITVATSLCLFVSTAHAGPGGTPPKSETDSIDTPDSKLKKEQMELSTLVGTNGRSFASVDEQELATAIEKKRTPHILLTSFFSQSTVCKLPRRLARKLKRGAKGTTEATSSETDETKKGRRSSPFIPDAVTNAISDVRDTPGEVLAGVSLASAVHRATVGDGDLVTFDSSPTASSVDIAGLIHKGSNHLLYSLDCSGYLSASMKAAGGTAAVRVDASIAGKLESSASMLAIRGKIAAPLGLALRPEAYQDFDPLSEEERLGLFLTVAAATANRSPDDKVTVPQFFYLVGTAAESGQSAQGRVDISGEGGGGIGVVQVDASAKAGFSIAKRVSFGVFDTILLPAPPGEKATIETTVKEIREAAGLAIARARVGVSLNTVENEQVLRPRLPKSVCELDWRLDSTAAGDSAFDAFGHVNTTFVGGVCEFEFRLNATGVEALGKDELVVKLERLGHAMRVADPK